MDLSVIENIDEDAIMGGIEDAAMVMKDAIVAAAIELAKALVVILKNYVAGMVAA